MDAGDEIKVANDVPDQERLGAMLRARRLELGLSQADVASVVKLPSRRIESMEHDRWDELPDGPFLRGFLRNVARALSLDAGALIERVEASLIRSGKPERVLTMPVATSIPMPRRRNALDDRRGGRALVYGAFAFALIAALIAWSGTDSFVRVSALAKAMIGTSIEAVTGPRTGPGNGVAPTPGEPGTRPPSAGTAGPSALSAPPSAASSALALLFHFYEDAWVEVRSGDGKVLLQRLNAAGSEQEVDGEAPFSLVVGNAKGVALRFRGQPVDLTPHTRDQVARLTLS